ncbi:MAG: S9 family peptidase, partial [Alphaproteobacteria bacterium]|nr:S9 family peptidase [Alphaproteobacteria bacterium]
MHFFKYLLAASLSAAMQLTETPAAALTTAAAPNGPISAADFAALPFLSDAQISPDGTKIAARVSGDGRETIAIWTLNHGNPSQPLLIPASGNQSFQWAGDTHLLITLTSTFSINSGGNAFQVPVQQASSFDLETHNSRTLGTGFVQNVIFADPLGRYILLSSLADLDHTPRVLRIDLATGASVEVQPPVHGVWTWFADSQGVVRVGADYEEHRTRIYYRPSAGAPLQLVDNRRNSDDDSVIDSVRFLTNTNRGIVITNAETGRFAVYDYDFATNTRGAVLFARPDVDVTRAIYNVDGGLDGVAYEDDRPHVHWMTPELERLQARIDHTFPDHTNTILDRSRDGNRVLVFSSAADDPGTYYVFDQAARRMEIFASPYTNLVGRRFAPVRSVTYRSRDGLDIPAYLTLPPGRGEHGLPLIVMPHGGPFARDSWEFDPQVQFLASRGYAVLQPNYRGSTGYGRQFAERGYGQWGTGMIDDVDDGVDWLVHQGIADGSRVCIMGASYGGYAALWGAMRSPQRYRCAISFAGPTDLRAMLRYNANPFIPRRYVREFQSRIRGEEQTDLDAISPLRHPEMLRVPLLIAHAAHDPVVPPRQSVDLLNA